MFTRSPLEIVGPLFVAVGLVCSGAWGAEPPGQPRVGQFTLSDGDRVVLLGGTFIERLQATGDFELEVQCALPESKIAFRNLGWSGDTVWGDSRAVFGQRADGFKRLLNDVALCQPTVILVCYGENEAFAGEAGLADFRAGLTTLLNQLAATGARLVLAAPPQRPKLPGRIPDPTPFNETLRKYAEVLRETAQARGDVFVDWSSFVCDDPTCYDGMHFSRAGYARLAPLLAATLGAARTPWQVRLDQQTGDYQATGLLVDQLTLTPVSFSLQGKSRFLAGAPITAEETDLSQFRVTGYRDRSAGLIQVGSLACGRYEVRYGNAPPFAATDVELAAGVSPPPPQAEQLRELLATIRRKDFLFFNRYRPQNETYLFLFRKHEQGNNAVEIPQFDALVEQLDQKIAELKRPAALTLQLQRIGDRTRDP